MRLMMATPFDTYCRFEVHGSLGVSVCSGIN